MSLRLSSVRRSTARSRQHAQARRSRRLWLLEGLEGRVLLSGNPTYYTVNLTSDTGASSGTDAYPTAGTPSGDLLWAITQANANTNAAGTVIDFDPNDFATPQTITVSTTLVLSESAGPEVIDGPSAGVVISGNNAVEVFQVGGGVTGTLAGLTISGGSATYGGGIDNEGTLLVSDSTIEDNSASYGGGIYNNDGVLSVTGSTIDDNSAVDNGGGLYSQDGSVTVTGSTIEDNSGSYGGGIGNFAVTMTVSESTIANNSALDLGGGGSGGGGIFNWTLLTVTGCTIEHNMENAAGGDGGGIYNSGTMAVSDSTIAGNTAASYGGGIFNWYGLLTVTDCTIENNSVSTYPDDGGGIVNLATLTVNSSTISGNSTGDYGSGAGIANGGALTITNSTIANNSTGYDANGGGIFNGFLNVATLTAVNTTIAYNDAYNSGGGLSDSPGSTATLDNTIVAVDTPDDINGAGISSASTYNLVGVDETGSLSNGSNGNDVVGATNPGLGALAYNGGPTQTIALLTGSPAIDAGSNSLANDYALTTDQRGGGFPRIVNGTVDIGAFELQAAPVTTTTTTLSSLADPSVLGQSVTFKATVAPTAGSGTPAGTVQFVIDGTDFGSPVPLVDGSATSPAISSLSVASHTIEAVYNGGTNFAASSGTLTQTVNAAIAPGSVPPTGSVSYYVGAVNPADLIGTGALSTNSNGVTTATFSTHSLPAGTYAITAVYGGDTNYPGSTSNVVSQTVNPAPLSITANNQAKVYGQANPALTVSYSGFVNGDTAASLTTGPTVTTTATTTSPVGSYPITATGAVEANYTISYVAGTLTISRDATTTVVSSSTTSTGFGQTVTFSATVTANSPGSGTPTGSVDFLDTATGDDLGSVTLASGKASLSTASLPVGSNTIKVTYSGDGNFLTSNASTGTITIGQSIIVLDPTAGGALSLSGNATIKLAGGVFVDSSSSSALSASGNATVKASVIDVHGGVQKSGNASFSPSPTTGAAMLADPLASLASPSTTGLTNYGSVSLSGNSSATIKPGIYAGITVSGNGTLTLNSGLYIIDGGGFTVSGNASVVGSGVTIFNAGSKYPTTGGTYGSVTLSGNGSYNLSPQTTGTYAGVVIFQSRDNTKALTFSGDASGMTGTIYAPAAQLAESGNAQLNAAVVVDTLAVSGNGVANIVTLNAPSGTVAFTPAQIRDAYGINALALDGTGQTIAIVDAYDDPSIDQALDAFDSQFGLTSSGPSLYAQYGPASSFLRVLNQSGQATSLPGTDPNGPGTDNWEVEEALDVEWAHAIAPGAQIILVEANSQSLSDLMAGVATAASQPGISVVSMSWGFPEGQAVFASDEATYDSVLSVPGVTFVASTGDYGAADPEYPAFSPNVVAVGGTSLTLNANNSYNSETGWGYYSSSVGAFIGSGGGISLYETEPVYQQGAQSTGYRTAPDVSLVADPATGAWIADTYNLDPSNPFEVVGGTSLSAPAWAGLFALVNQGRAANGESTLNSVTATDAQQSLYKLPQSAYSVITSGNNGYSAADGYNLVTGLGTPVASVLVPDLIAYQGPGTTYSGSPVAPLQNSGLVNTGSTDSGPMDVFSVFDSLMATGSALDAHGNRMPAAGLTRRAEPSPGIDGDSVGLGSPADIFVPIASSTGNPATGWTPLDSNAARDAVLADWVPARMVVKRPTRHSVVARSRAINRTPLALGGSRTLVLQAKSLDRALEGLGAPPLLMTQARLNRK